MENTEENCEMIWTIWKKVKLNNEKMRKIWNKAKLNSERIWEIQKKGNSEKDMEYTEERQIE
jgi:hypothetical protein